MVQAPGENSRLELFHDISLAYHRKISTQKFNTTTVLYNGCNANNLYLLNFDSIFEE